MELTKLSKPQLLTKCEELGINVFSVDLQWFDEIDLAIDVENLQHSHIPFTPNATAIFPI